MKPDLQGEGKALKPPSSKPLCGLVQQRGARALAKRASPRTQSSPWNKMYFTTSMDLWELFFITSFVVCNLFLPNSLRNINTKCERHLYSLWKIVPKNIQTVIKFPLLKTLDVISILTEKAGIFEKTF